MQQRHFCILFFRPLDYIIVGLIQSSINCQLTGGSIFTRWGRSSCPNKTGVELLYEGYAAGSYYSHAGSGSNYLCLPRNPIYGQQQTGEKRGYVYGAEYEIPTTFLPGIENHDVPCAVCRVPGSSVLMIPGRNQCFPNWRLEYDGYLVSEYYTNAGIKEYVCLDGHPETLNFGVTYQNGAQFYLVEGRCGSLKCPPYVEGYEITCAVCSNVST